MKKFKICFFIIFLFIMILFSCSYGQANKKNSVLVNHNPFQELIDSVVIKNDSVIGVLMHIESSNLNISWTGAAGFDEIGKKSVLRPNQPFRIASITKTFVATAILRLYEDNKLSLNDTIGKYLSETHMNILNKGSYITDRITIRHLLNNTHGIYDYAMTDFYLKRIIENPHHWWTRTEQLEIAIKEGEPQGNPGDQFNYSDTGYILLGEIIEYITGKSLAESIREIIGFEQIGLNYTWMEYFEKKPKELSEIVHPYLNGKDFYNISPSIDLYGGGGLVSTVTDISIFFQSLFEGKIFKKNTTVDTMKTKTLFPDYYKPSQDYRMGIQVSEINGIEIYYHTGIWGSMAVYIPDFKTSIAINFTKDYDPKVIVESLIILKKLKNN